MHLPKVIEVEGASARVGVDHIDETPDDGDRQGILVHVASAYGRVPETAGRYYVPVDSIGMTPSTFPLLWRCEGGCI